MRPTFRPIKFGQAAAMAVVTLAGAATLAPAAIAGNPVTVGADRVKLVPIAGTPATVIIGNSLFADVTIQRGKIVIHGKHFGSTNVIVLDRAGNQLAELDVTVVRSGRQNVVVYKAGETWSYKCAPNCEFSLQVGDSDTIFTNKLQKQIDSKTTSSINAATAGGD